MAPRRSDGRAGMTDNDRHKTMDAARVGARLSVQDLWLRYLALGGSSDAFDVDGYLQGMVFLDSFQQDVLAQALNEALEDLCRSLQVPLSATSGVEVVHRALHNVIQELLAPRPDAPDETASSPGGDEAQTAPPRTRPEG
jgi:hypothetical protein